MDKRTYHLQYIQNVINRMSVNSFLLKGWTVVLISALFALGAGIHTNAFIWLAFFPSIVFWILDGYYLRQERLFRALYDEVRVTEENETDFSMETTLVSEKVDCWGKVIVSKTLLIFHGVIFLSILIVLLFFYIFGAGNGS